MFLDVDLCLLETEYVKKPSSSVKVGYDCPSRCYSSCKLKGSIWGFFNLSLKGVNIGIGAQHWRRRREETWIIMLRSIRYSEWFERRGMMQYFEAEYSGHTSAYHDTTWSKGLRSSYDLPQPIGCGDEKTWFFDAFVSFDSSLILCGTRDGCYIERTPSSRLCIPKSHIDLALWFWR